ncbi:MAG: thiamine phosphate synthase [Acidobacteriota bacterium]|nr:thiamine phosphate synthase [Acidobacteriota bacterium]
MGRSIAHDLGSPGRPVACAICAVRGLSADHLVELCSLGVDFLQLRDREASDREFERFLEVLASEARDVLSRVVVNDRLALAAAFPVAGVHLPATGLPVAAVRSRFPRGRLLLGRSVHGVDAAVAAERDGADYVILGPVAPTGGKRPLPPDVFRETCRRLRIPVWAVGGLTPENLERLRGVGVSGFAAIRSFRDAARARAFVARRPDLRTVRQPVQ